MEPLSAPAGKTKLQPLLSTSLTAQGTTQVVTVKGEMDTSSVAQVGNVIDRALAARPETLVLDLTELAFCDSSGVHLVLRTHQRTQVDRTRMRVMPPTGAARRIFDICCVEDYVTFVTVDESSAL